MKRLIPALFLAAAALPASAETSSVDLESLSCRIMMAHIQTEGIIAADVANYLDGVLAAIAAAKPDDNSIPTALLSICVAEDGTIAETIRSALATE